MSVQAIERRRSRLAVRLRVPPSGSLRAGLGLLGALLAVSVVVPLLAPDPQRQSLGEVFRPPGTRGHLLGTDFVGRDVLAWTAGGIRLALVVALCVVLLSAAIGVAVGLTAGYFGGMPDTVAMRFADFELAIPPLLLFIAASAVLEASFLNLVLLMSAVSWVPYARLVRARVLAERERGYVAAAKLAGTPRRGILFRHLLRSVVTVVLVMATLQVGYVLLWESGLSFLGLGLQPPHTSLGYLVAQGEQALLEAWWVAVVPGLAIVLLIVATNLIGDGLRDVYHADVEVLRT